MAITIDKRRLNLVVEVERSDGTTVHVHSVPITEEVYEAHWELLSLTVTRLYSRGMLPAAAVRVAYKMLRKIADELGVLEQANADLFPNIWRLTTIITQQDGKFVPMPFDVALAGGNALDSEDLEEVRNYIAFFTSASWVHPRRELKGLYERLADCGALLVSSNATEYAASLMTSTKKETTSTPTVDLSPPH